MEDGGAAGRRAAIRSGRVRAGLAVAAAVCILLVSIGTSYALADEPEPPPPAAAVGAPVPSTADIVGAYEAARRKEEERESELEEPGFVAEREASRHAYADLSDAEAEALLKASFPEAFEALSADPARYLSDATLKEPLGDGDAVVRSDGKTALLEGSIPVETTDAEGELSKVDLDLEHTPEGFEPANPLVEVGIGTSADEGIEVGEEDLTLTQAGADATSVGRPLGDKNVFFHEVEEGSDTDLLVSPTTSGVEMFDMLRSVDSPETLRFHVELPEGAGLQATSEGGAEVVAEDGTILYRIPRPVSTDAQGSEIPTTLEIEGSSMVVQVPHREQEVDYPVLVDPVIQDWNNPSWYNNENLQGLNAWVHYESSAGNGISYGTTDEQWNGHRGLFLAAEPGFLGSNVWDEWAYFAPNEHSYISKAVINTFWRGDKAPCTLVKDPYDFDGMYLYSENGTPVTPHWNGGTHTNDAYSYGNSEVNSWGNEFVFGYGNASAKYNLCWRNLMNGGSQIWLEDWNYPYLSSIESPPTGWLKKDHVERRIKVTASDEGLGVRRVRLFGVGTPTNWEWHPQNCAGTYESPCPNSATGEVPYTTDGFPYEGERKYSVQAEDPTEKKWTSQEFTLHLDGLAPAISLSGQLANATAPEGLDKLSLPIYNLKIKAEDLLEGGPNFGSGVKEITLKIDGESLKSKAASCSSSSCPSKLEWTYPLTLTGLTEGKHTLEIGASDFVGNEAKPESHKIEFEYVPATGMKEEYVLQHFVLPDGHEYSGEEYEGPELAVNVTNGNVVYHERDLQVPAPSGHQLELERIYNSQQPVARDGQWGHGWSLAQTPEFKPEGSESTPKTGRMLRTSAITSAVHLPESSSQSVFSALLHAFIAKTRNGYEVRSAIDEEAQVFNSSGRIEETRLSNVSPELTVTPEPVFPVYAESLGAPGTGNGQLNHPADVAVDAKGNIWVVDKANNRIEEFNEASEFVRAVGSAGAGAGQLSSPSALVIDSLGNIDVTDTANNRVTRFNEKGEFISAIGWNVNKTKLEGGGTQLEKNLCTAASGNVCQAGLAGSGEGQISEPIGITTTGSQNFLVVERANSRVEKFSPQAELLAKFGSLGSEPGQLKEPTAIAYSPTGGGNLWVADTGNNRIEEWTTSYSFVRAVGKEGSGQGEFKRPAAVEADSEGNVYVGDQGKQRIQELSKSGDFITQFGSEGQFSFSAPMGIFLDSAGDLWITDSERNQVQEWLTGSFLFKGARIGSLGTGNGQFNHPADVAPDGKGNLWVLDKGNNRLEKFNETGEFLAAIGSNGGAAGQLNAPSALAIDSSGNLWVADTANNRIEEFNEKGEFVLVFGRSVNKTKIETPWTTEAERGLCTAASGNVCQAGVAGSTNGQMKAPQGIAATSGGNLWVADTGNSRLKKFGPTGSLINTISSEGSEAGKVKEPTAIAMGPEGSLWVADTANNRIEEWNSSLAFVAQFGSEGTGNGYFKRPAALDVDAAGNVWVGDQNNERIQQFNSSGEYVAQLGGSAQFALSGPMGVAADNKGGLWITDTDHNRVQRILTSEFETPVATQAPAIDYSYSGTVLAKMELKEPAASDPAITVATTSGLATSATSEAGTATYSYSSANLTAKKGPEGETKFERDASNRITKIELPNGTWAKISYDSTGRATKVTVKPAGGTEKTTNFLYSTEPRETLVWGGGNPEIIYYLGEDGSVLKWEYATTPPTLASISGSLWAKKGEEVDNKDQTLFVTAESQNEIASIKVIANGNAVVAEKTCEDKSEPPAHNCNRPEPLEWISNPSEFAPGRLDLEIIATDFLGHSTAERFFVVIPQQPLPDPEADEPPDFKSTLKFREDYGLDRESQLTRPEINKLVLELLYEWEAQVPAAVAGVEQWGVPLRAPELADMESRRESLNRASEVIPLWAEEHAPNAYAGFYVDDRAGGIIYVGFTETQTALVEALKSDSRLIDPSRIHGFPMQPTISVRSLEEAAPSVALALMNDSEMSQVTSSVHVAPEEAAIQVGATDVGRVSSFVSNHFGSLPISVRYEHRSVSAVSRYAGTGPLLGGAALYGLNQALCTAGFGARAPVGESQGKTEYKYFSLTAGHCYPEKEYVYRETARLKLQGTLIGEVRRNAYTKYRLPTDAGAIWIAESLRSHSVLGKHDGELVGEPIQGVQSPRDGEDVCWSGIFSGGRCGKVMWHGEVLDETGHLKVVYRVMGLSIQGDSGAPVWDRETHRAVGLIASTTEGGGGSCWETFYNAIGCTRMEFTPLLKSGGAAGVLPELGVTVLTAG